MNNNISPIWDVEKLQKAWLLAAQLHDGQQYMGRNKGEKFTYLTHIGFVTFEVLTALTIEPQHDNDLAISCAILHDTIEDTTAKIEQINQLFGQPVADGVLALTKNESLGSKRKQMIDSLARIQTQPKSVWLVKLADRIANLQPPPYYWTTAKATAYREEAILIHDSLGEASPYLSHRLLQKIERYKMYI